MARIVQLAQQVDGINLMRSKGGASPGSLFDLKNGWVTSKRTIKARPGTVKDVTFPAETVGVVGFENKFHTFTHLPYIGTLNPLVVVNILRHPTGGSAALKRIHRAAPFLGRLYVVAEFTDGVVQHYWIEAPTAWAASTAHTFGAVVQPTTATGFYYELKTASTVPAWQANTETVVGDIRQPRVANGFKYTASAVTGTAPIRTGNTEPVWPTVAGATVTERRYVTEAQVPPGSTTPTDPATGTPQGGGGGTNTEYGPFPPYFDETAPRQKF